MTNGATVSRYLSLDYPSSQFWRAEGSNRRREPLAKEPQHDDLHHP